MQTVTTYTNNLFYSRKRLVNHNCMLPLPGIDVISTPSQCHFYPLSMSFLPYIDVISTPCQYHFNPLSISLQPPIDVISTPYQCHFYPLLRSSQPTMNTTSTHYEYHFNPLSGAENRPQTPPAMTINPTGNNYKLHKEDITSKSFIHIINKKGVVILFLMMICITAFSQNIEINRTIDTYPNTSLSTPFIATSIAALGNDYIVGAFGYDTINNTNQSVVFFKIDTLGNATKKLIFSRNGYFHFMHYSTYIYSTQDSGYCTTLIKDTNSYPESIVVRLNSNFDTLWTKILPQQSQLEVLVQVIETSDKSLMCLGYKVMSTTVSDILLIKTDSAANILWKKTITFGNFSKGFHISETPDKGFFISGGRGSNAFGDSRPLVMKLDSAGNIKWYRILGNNNLYQGVVSAVTPQGDYVVAYGYSTYTSPSEDYTYGRVNVIKYNQDGYVIWDRMYDTIKNNNSVSSIRILPNNNIVVIGFNYVENGNGVNNFYHQSFILSLSANGDSLGYKYFTNMNSFADQNIIYDNVLNADGSITAIGKVESFNILHGCQIWLVKTGNVLTTDVKESYYTQKGEINIFPNPATTQTTITYPYTEKALTLQIYNMLGQKVYEEKLSKGSSQTTINTTGFKPGLYKVVAGERSARLIIN